MKNSMPIVTVLPVRNTCCKSYSTVACLSIRPLSISGNDFCIFRIEKTGAGRWCCISSKRKRGGALQCASTVIGKRSIKTFLEKASFKK